MLYIIDTNVFLRTLIKEEEKTFQECRALLESIKHQTLTALVPGIALSEIVWTLHSYYEFPKSKVVKAIHSILNLRGIEVVDNYDYRLALDLYESKSVKYVDACIASLPQFQNNNAVVVSYDRDFDKLGVKRKEPGDF